MPAGVGRGGATGIAAITNQTSGARNRSGRLEGLDAVEVRLLSALVVAGLAPGVSGRSRARARLGIGAMRAFSHSAGKPGPNRNERAASRLGAKLGAAETPLVPR